MAITTTLPGSSGVKLRRIYVRYTMMMAKLKKRLDKRNQELIYSAIESYPETASSHSDIDLILFRSLEHVS